MKKIGSFLVAASIVFIFGCESGEHKVSHAPSGAPDKHAVSQEKPSGAHDEHAGSQESH